MEGCRVRVLAAHFDGLDVSCCSLVERCARVSWGGGGEGSSRSCDTVRSVATRYAGGGRVMLPGDVVGSVFLHVQEWARKYG